MAKSARFHTGTSGSPKHTEVVGASGFGGGAASAPAERGISVGPGVEGRRVNPNYNATQNRGSSKSPRGMKRYAEE